MRIPRYTLRNVDAVSSISRLQRERLSLGAIVKLGFVVDPVLDGPTVVEREWMWVRVSSHSTALGYTGRLRNEPLDCKGVEFNDLIRFGPEHVWDLAPPDDRPRYRLAA